MTSLRAMLQATEDGLEYTTRPPTQAQSGVRRSSELVRIATMASWRTDELKAPIEALIEPRGDVVLRPIQRAALVHAWHVGGLFAPLGVGTGKTLIANLLPTVLGRRAIIIVKASLEAQFRRMRAQYARSFALRGDTKVVSLGVMSHASGTNLLERAMPEIVIVDEAHLFAGKDSSRTRRLRRYWEANPQTQFCFLSGSMTRKRIKDFAHLLEMALGSGSPLPLNYPTLTEWAECLDQGKRPRKPGHLRLLAPAETVESPEDARKVWSKRLYATAGVIGDPEGERLPCSLTIRRVEAPRFPAIEQALAQLEATWTRPDGEELISALDVYRVAREMRQGGFHRWREPPPHEWLEARRNWHTNLREWLKRNADTHYDSPLLVANAIRRGEIPELSDVYAAWLHERGKIPDPATTWQWIDTGYVEHIARELKTRTQAWIAWTDIVVVGKAIAHAAGCPYYGAGDEAIANERGDRSIVASVQAHGTGRNLQAFSRSLLVSCPSAGADMEQLLGRTHRQGQPADEVEVEFFDTFNDTIKTVVKDAKYISQVLGQEQRILFADKEHWEVQDG